TPPDPPSPLPKKRKSSPELHDIDPILNSLQEVEEKLDSIFRVTKNDKIPFGIKTSLSEVFQCKICLRCVSLPVMVATCCGQLIGCQSCTDTWYTTGPDIMKKTCPACRAERGAARLCQLRGMDSLINNARDILQEAQPTPEDVASDHSDSSHSTHEDLPIVNM
ncbi:MAG: hypothetical protein MPL62_18365, partial [Alphaproteobacteria bacterium]|nr:hypothetical protein [Alphaproteobacteria bacterium]